MSKPSRHAPTLRPGTPEAVGMLPERLERAREIAADAVASGRTTSLVALVARRGVVVLHEAFGRLRPDADDTPLPREAIFPLSSATKPVTATLAMILVEEGRLGLARPAVDYLPELSGDGIDQLLVHHLMTHTSGFDDTALFTAIVEKIGSEGPRQLPANSHPLNALPLAYAGELPRACQAGEQMIYANTNYTLLGEILQRVSGVSLEELARERLFGPLGMKGAGYTVRDDMREHLLERASGAPFSENGVLPGTPGFRSEEWRQMQDGGAGLHASAMDIAVFAQMHLNRGRYGDARILSAPGATVMSQDQLPGMKAKVFGMPERAAGYGLGWLIDTHECWRYLTSTLLPRGSFHHTGAGGTNFWVDPQNEIVGVYFEVATEVTPDLETVSWSCDLFQNVVTSAVED